MVAQEAGGESGDMDGTTAGDSAPSAATAGPEGDVALMAKTLEAFRYSALAYVGNRISESEAVTAVQGRQAQFGKGAGCAMMLRWRPDTRSLVISVRGSHRLFQAVVMGPPDTACPCFLERLQPEARVHAAILQVFEDFTDPAAPDSLPATLRSLLAGAQPRSILACAYCVGGAVCSVAAAWAALRWPAADVRCIVFGTPRVGNAKFAEVFNWLVGLSYRCVYQWDPMPVGPGQGLMAPGLLSMLRAMRLEFSPTHSDVFLDSGGRARLQDRPISLHYKWQDHELKAYLGTLLKLVAEHACDLAPPVNALGQKQLVDPGVVEREESLSAAAHHHDDRWRSGTPGGSHAGPAGSASAHTAALSIATDGASWGAAPPSHVPLQRTASLPATPALTQRHHSLSAGIRRVLRRAVSCQPGEQEAAEEQAAGRALPAADTEAGLFGGLGPGQTRSGALAPAAPVDQGRWRTVQGMWGEILRSVEELSQVQQSMWREGEGYVGDAEADRLAEAWAAGSALAHMSLQCGGAPPAGPETAGGAGAAAAGGAPQSSGPSCWAAGEAAAQGQQGQQGQQPPACDDDLCGMPPALQVLVAQRLRLPLQLSLAAYHDCAGFKQATGIGRCQLVDDRAYDAQVHVAWLPDGAAGTAVFAFRGTSSRQQALMDFKFLRRQVEFLPTQFPGAKAHLGFLQQCLAVTSASNPSCNLGCVLAGLSGGATPTRVICTGHSLGGAVATLASVWAALQYPLADVRCFSFGSPRVGNAKFVRAYQTLVGMRVRVVHGADPIPSLPPAWLPRLRYRHVWPACHLHGSELALSLKSLHLLPSLKDHQLLMYAKALASAAHVSLEEDSVKLEKAA